MYSEYQGFIFNGGKVLKFSQMLTVRPGGADPPYGQLDRKISVIFFDDFPNQDIGILRHLARIKISGVVDKIFSHKYSDDDQQDGEVGSSQASASLL